VFYALFPETLLTSGNTGKIVVVRCAAQEILQSFFCTALEILQRNFKISYPKSLKPDKFRSQSFTIFGKFQFLEFGVRDFLPVHLLCDIWENCGSVLHNGKNLRYSVVC